MFAIELRMDSFDDAPPVAIIRAGGVGIPNLSAWPRIERNWPSIIARTYIKSQDLSFHHLFICFHASMKQ